MYKITHLGTILRTLDGAAIPRDINNVDYQEYVGWVESGNAPEREVINQCEDARQLRESAYRLESDPLFMEWKYDGDPKKEDAWRSKVLEIKQRYPIDI